MPLDFLTPRVERLAADGSWTVEHPGGGLGRFRAPVVLLARELVVFSRFETAALPRGRRAQAARLQARAASPYFVNSSMLIKSGADFGIWWWDAERVAAMVVPRWPSQRVSIRPETLAQPPGANWRIVRLAQGYEAQLWRSGRLHASAWRRERFDAAAWAAFVRTQRGPEDAPAEPPPPQVLPVDYNAAAFALNVAEITPEQIVALGGGAVAVASVCITMFLAGQGLKLSAEAKDIEAETLELAGSTLRPGQVQGLEANRRRLTAFREIEENTSPLSAAGAAIGIVAFYDLTPTAMDAQQDSLSITLPYGAVGTADVLINDFQNSGYFYDIQPRTDAQNQRLIIDMKTRPSAPPLNP